MTGIKVMTMRNFRFLVVLPEALMWQFDAICEKEGCVRTEKIRELIRNEVKADNDRVAANTNAVERAKLVKELFDLQNRFDVLEGKINNGG